VPRKSHLSNSNAEALSSFKLEIHHDELTQSHSRVSSPYLTKVHLVGLTVVLKANFPKKIRSLMISTILQVALMVR
jgi:hypothetical protein